MTSLHERSSPDPAASRPPRFSVILVHFQGSTSHSSLLRAVHSVNAQTCQDFELLAYHNGPLLPDRPASPVPLICSETNTGNWGYANRDRGIREAKGDYIVHLSSDCVLFPDALETLSKTIDSATFSPPMLVFQINDVKNSRLLTGDPPKLFNIDCMQGVVRREIWLLAGGWYERGPCADGIMLERFAEHCGYFAIRKILGEHR